MFSLKNATACCAVFYKWILFSKFEMFFLYIQQRFTLFFIKFLHPQHKFFISHSFFIHLTLNIYTKHSFFSNHNHTHFCRGYNFSHSSLTITLLCWFFIIISSCLWRVFSTLCPVNVDQNKFLVVILGGC